MVRVSATEAAGYLAVSLPHSDHGQVVHTHVPVTKQYNVAPVTGQRCFLGGKVTVGLILHCPRVLDFVDGLATVVVSFIV